MKIQYSYNKSLKASETADSRKAARTLQDRQGVPGQSAEVQLSPMTARMKAAETAMAKTASFDQKRVEELRTAIAEGRFKINPEAIAERLLQSVGELLGTSASL